MNYNILEFDSSNIKILNDIETISGKIKEMHLKHKPNIN